MVLKKYELKNGQVLVIREAQKKDASEILEYVNKMAGETDYLTFGQGEFNVSLEDEEKFLENCVESSNHFFIVAEIGGTLIGNLSFKGGDKPKILHTGEIGATVLKKYWGLGIGSVLVGTLIEWAKSSWTIKKLNLRVRPDNDRAIRLYERFGFVREGLITREYFIDGKFYDSIFMGLQIN